ncbi:MAG: UDP-N-acetylmuramoyl-L-alanyl-D-glutamate--2,6-diaminopimelate ligase [Fibrobacteres bacterium]|nr:UDP-N-acetylmuramoyl-L-alanyl-D-glutamate--2,6-diaminopimelate ligase [Fibrobacterota bacterium]
MKLTKVLNGIKYSGEIPQDADVTAVTCVSSECGAGSLFFALKGEKLDGAAFIPDAVSRGCRYAVVSADSNVDTDKAGCTVIKAVNGREAMAIASSNIVNGAEKSLTICGITGTSGKTTVSYLMDSIMREERPSTVIGTIQHLINGETVDSANTTPEAFTLHSLLEKAVKNGAKHAVMEVSSHSLKLKRVHALDFDAAIFTNISRDHMDFHLTEEDYIDSKCILFRDRLKSSGVAAINIDDANASKFIKASTAGVITYGIKSDKALVKPLNVIPSGDGMIIELATPAGPLTINTALKGPFNIYNIMAVVAAATGLGYSGENIVKGIERLKSVSGRFEAVNAGQPFTVIVDYAHKPDALDNVLRAAREITKGKLISVFGCGGDRDKGKRPLMGAISEKYADFTILTSDNPRTESPDTIIDEIKTGFSGTGKFTVVADRREAIKTAVKSARPGDCLVIAGKGHETYQIVGKVKNHFDDREEARAALEEIYGHKN